MDSYSWPTVRHVPLAVPLANKLIDNKYPTIYSHKHPNFCFYKDTMVYFTKVQQLTTFLQSMYDDYIEIDTDDIEEKLTNAYLKVSLTLLLLHLILGVEKDAKTK